MFIENLFITLLILIVLIMLLSWITLVTCKRQDDGDAKIIGSCNGLLCFWNYDFYNFIVFLFNPTTRTYKVIPVLPRPSCVAGLTNKFIHGFGYDSVSDDYKFARISSVCGKGVVSYSKLVVYSLKSDSWMSTWSCPYSLHV